MTAELKCPNCGTPAAAGASGRIICSACGGTFTFDAALGEHKLVAVGDFDRLAADVEDLKKKVMPPADSPPAKPPQPETGDDGENRNAEPAEEDDDDEDL